jgi:hypothetical protein
MILVSELKEPEKPEKPGNYSIRLIKKSAAGKNAC